MLFVGGHGHLCEGGDLIGVGAEAAGGDGVSQEVGSGGANFGFGGGSLFLIVVLKFLRVIRPSL